MTTGDSAAASRGLTLRRSGKAAPHVPPTPIRRHGVATILLAEDEPAVRSLVERVLVQAGHTVMSAADGIAAIDLATRNDGNIDLFLTDVVMPGPTGIEAARRIRLERPNLPVLYMSGWATEALVREGLREEEIRLLAKPFSVSELLEAVRVAIDEDPATA